MAPTKDIRIWKIVNASSRLDISKEELTSKLGSDFTISEYVIQNLSYDAELALYNQQQEEYAQYQLKAGNVKDITKEELKTPGVIDFKDPIILEEIKELKENFEKTNPGKELVIETPKIVDQETLEDNQRTLEKIKELKENNGDPNLIARLEKLIA